MTAVLIIFALSAIPVTAILSRTLLKMKELDAQKSGLPEEDREYLLQTLDDVAQTNRRLVERVQQLETEVRNLNARALHGRREEV